MTTPAPGEPAASPVAAGLGADAAPARGQPARVLLAAFVAAAAACCLVVAVLAGAQARTRPVRPPTAAQRSAAAAAAVAQRWRTWPAGRIFPARLGYTTPLGTRETARRAGIAAGSGCAAALDSSLAGQAARDGCQAALRATYADELQGVVYTAGVLVFAAPSRAAAFLRAVAGHLRASGSGPGAAGPQPVARRRGEQADFSVPMTAESPRYGLRAHVVAGTAAARFGSAARQVMTGRQQDGYVVLTVAGYADGLAEPGSESP